MLKKNYGKQEGMQFNSSIQFLERLERRFEDSNESKIDGQLITYYRSTQTIMHTIMPFMTPEEKVFFNKIDDEAYEEIKNLTRNVVDPGFIYEDAEKTVDKLYIELMRIGVEKKLIYYQYEKQAWDEELEGDYS